jgi:hypothetical protein
MQSTSKANKLSAFSDPRLDIWRARLSDILWHRRHKKPALIADAMVCVSPVKIAV